MTCLDNIEMDLNLDLISLGSAVVDSSKTSALWMCSDCVPWIILRLFRYCKDSETCGHHYWVSHRHEI